MSTEQVLNEQDEREWLSVVLYERIKKWWRLPGRYFLGNSFNLRVFRDCPMEDDDLFNEGPLPRKIVDKEPFLVLTGVKERPRGIGFCYWPEKAGVRMMEALFFPAGNEVCQFFKEMPHIILGKKKLLPVLIMPILKFLARQQMVVRSPRVDDIEKFLKVLEDIPTPTVAR